MNLWNIYARFYDVLRSNPVTQIFHRNEQESIQILLNLIINIPTDGSALDLGCGTGINLRYIPSDFSHIFALDKSSEMVARTGKIFKHVEMAVGDACSTHYSSGSMDLILCVGVSEYVSDLHLLVAEIFRVLDLNGYVIITSSPPNVLNHMRILMGNKTYLRSISEFETALKTHQFSIVKTNHTPIQDQFLIKKNLQAVSDMTSSI